jgi:hypothetical protein
MSVTSGFAPPSKDASLRRNRPLLHRDAARPILIHRPTADDRAIHGISGGFEEAMRLLRRAAMNAASMSALRRVADLGQTHTIGDRQVLEYAARQIACGRWVVNVAAAPNTAAKEPYGAAHDNAYRERLTVFENDIPYMYLDSEGKVTVGIGIEVRSPAETRSIRFIHRYNGKLASDAEKEAAYQSVFTAPLRKLSHHRYKGLTDLDLAPGESARLFSSRLELAESECRKLFRNWADFPRPAQLALLDMDYNMGKGAPLTPARIAQGATNEGGLFQFHKLRAAAEKGDWLTASRECHRKKPIPEDRNNWTRDKFIEAAHLSPPAAESDRATKL